MRVGILGGGQLGRMLAEAALRLKIKPVVYAESAQSPASFSGAEERVGLFTDESRLRSFFLDVDCVVYENEFLNVPFFQQLSKEQSIRFFPQLEVLKPLQDKLEQKKIFKKMGLPSAEFYEFQDSEEIQQALLQLEKKWGTSFVLKWSRLGYDGKGVFFYSPSTQASALPFFREGKARGARIYAETKVDFSNELALVSCSFEHRMVFYPLVHSEQKNGICFLVEGPAVQLGVLEKLENEAQSIAQTLSNALALRGTFAIEFFLTREGKLLINEVAPRVHNSGHFSLLASPTSQFEQHIRAAFQLEPGAVASENLFLMMNLIGPPGVQKQTSELCLPSVPESWQVYLYGKREIRPGRKLGHINVLAKTPGELKRTEAELREWNRKWQEQL